MLLVNLEIKNKEKEVKKIEVAEFEKKSCMFIANQNKKFPRGREKKEGPLPPSQ
jgi:hypothetical protein